MKCSYLKKIGIHFDYPKLFIGVMKFWTVVEFSKIVGENKLVIEC